LREFHLAQAERWQRGRQATEIARTALEEKAPPNDAFGVRIALSVDRVGLPSVKFLFLRTAAGSIGSCESKNGCKKPTQTDEVGGKRAMRREFLAAVVFATLAFV